MLGRRKSKADLVKELTDNANRAADGIEENEYLAVRSRDKQLKDLIKTNMLFFVLSVRNNA